MSERMEFTIPGVTGGEEDPRDQQIGALAAENLMLLDRVAGLDREVEALRQRVADLLFLRAD